MLAVREMYYRDRYVLEVDPFNLSGMLHDEKFMDERLDREWGAGTCPNYLKVALMTAATQVALMVERYSR